MRFVPVVAVVAEEDLDYIRDQYRLLFVDDDVVALAEKNGWSTEMVVLGSVLSLTADAIREQNE